MEMNSLVIGETALETMHTCALQVIYSSKNMHYMK